MSEPPSETTVLLSGGVDSAALVAFLLAQSNSGIHGLFVDYGQAARTYERAAAQRIATHFDIPLAAISVEGLPATGPGLVTCRNALLVLLAASRLGQERGSIATGIHAGTGYVDCSRPFVDQIQCVLDLYSMGCVRLLAPFLDWAKSQTLEYARSSGVPFALTRSCEAGTPEPCGVCLSCRDMEAFDARESASLDVLR